MYEIKPRIAQNGPKRRHQTFAKMMVTTTPRPRKRSRPCHVPAEPRRQARPKRHQGFIDTMNAAATPTSKVYVDQAGRRPQGSLDLKQG